MWSAGGFVSPILGEEVKPGTEKSPVATIDETKEPDALGWTEANEGNWINAVAADWLNSGLTATVYDESGQVLSYRRSGNPITHEEIG